MITQTHVLIAALFLTRPGESGDRRERGARRLQNMAALFGSVLPDVSLYVMWGLARLRNIPDSVIWEELHFSGFWQQIGAVTNSIPLAVLIFIVCWSAGGRLNREGTRANPLASAFLAMSVAVLLHIAADIPLHHDDGRPHFWPFSAWIFESPVSYWDTRHYARWWMPVEIFLSMAIIIVLWKRFVARWIHGLLGLIAITYVGMLVLLLLY